MAMRRSIADTTILALLCSPFVANAQERNPTPDKPTTAPTTRPTTTQPSAILRPVAANETIVVGDQPAGGFTAVSPSTGEINLTWPAVAGANPYFVLRSDQPKLVAGFHVSDNRAICETNRYEDNEVEPDTTYYYAIIAVIGNDHMVLVASGRAKTLAVDGPLMPNENGLRGGVEK